MRHTKPRLARRVFSIFAMTLVFVVGASARGMDRAQSDVELGGAGKGILTVLYNFGSHEGDPLYPSGIVAQGRDGNLYSATAYGGASNDGAVFKITPTGTLIVTYDLSSYGGSSGLTLGTDGDFYGATIYGGNAPGYGTVFKITSRGKMTVLYDFTGQGYDAYPYAPPIQGGDGSFYGTAAGDFNGNGGIVYKITRSGTKSTLFQFDHKDGAAPVAPLIEGTDGSFYGTTNAGGNNGDCGSGGCGVIFKLTPKGKATVLHNFGAEYYPVAPLIEGNDGDFYGTAPYGGRSGNRYGAVFKITPTGKYTVLHTFQGGGDGIAPFAGVLKATDGNFYGVTAGGGASDGGTIYRVTPKGKYSVICDFDGTNGTFPVVALLQRTDGKLYGFAGEGGTFNYGTFYSLDLGLRPFARLVSTSGKAGKVIGVLGQGFTGTTSVSFHGTAARKFRVVSDAYLTATVPKGATTGFVTVTTPGGELQSSEKFRVTKSAGRRYKSEGETASPLLQ
jgi:uncharacterized repeat protein (TIGR03803 family)